MPTNHERAAALAESLRGMHTTSPTALKLIADALDAAHAEGRHEAYAEIAQKMVYSTPADPISALPSPPQR